MKKRTSYNPKRRITLQFKNEDVNRLIDAMHYGGNPEHKRNPGDFGLTPPSSPRLDKSCCDEVAITSRAEALRLLKKGVRKALVSVQKHHGSPQNIWSVTGDGQPLEAQLENAETCTYHGYPMPKSDPFRNVVLQRWEER